MISDNLEYALYAGIEGDKYVIERAGSSDEEAKVEANGNPCTYA